MGLHIEPDELRRWAERGLIDAKAAGLPDAIPIDDGADEKAFMADVVKYAKRNGWRCWHNTDARKSGKGWPDLVLVKGRLLIRELKTNRGATTPEQDEWIAALRAAGIDAGVWRPSDWKEIISVLT